MIRLSQQQNARPEIKTPKKISWKTRKLTIKALLKSQGGYSILDTPEGGLLDRGLLERGDSQRGRLIQKVK